MQSLKFESRPARGCQWIGSRPNKILVGAVAASFVVGYFVGREYIKYEMRSAFAGVAEGIGRAFGGGKQELPDSSKKQSKVSQVSPISSKLLWKGWQASEYGKNSLTFAVEFSNQTGKDV